MLVERHDRRWVAEYTNNAERRQALLAGEPEPAPTSGSLEVRIEEGTPSAFAAATLRAIAAQIEKGG